MVSKKKEKHKPPLPEEWVKPYRKIDLTTGLLVAICLLVFSVSVVVLTDPEPIAPFVESFVFVFFLYSVILVYLVVMGQWLGKKWGKKQNWYGWVAMVSTVNTLFLLFYTATSMAGLDLTGTQAAVGGILFLFTFQAYYKTTLKHAVYAFIAINLVVIVPIVLLLLLG